MTVTAAVPLPDAPMSPASAGNEPYWFDVVSTPSVPIASDPLLLVPPMVNPLPVSETVPLLMTTTPLPPPNPNALPMPDPCVVPPLMTTCPPLPTVSMPTPEPPTSMPPRPVSVPPFTVTVPLVAVLNEAICSELAFVSITVPPLLIASSAPVPDWPTVIWPASNSTPGLGPPLTMIVPPPLSVTPVASTTPPLPMVSRPDALPVMVLAMLRKPPVSVPPLSTEMTPWPPDCEPRLVLLAPVLTTPLLAISSEPKPLWPMFRPPKVPNAVIRAPVPETSTVPEPPALKPTFRLLLPIATVPPAPTSSTPFPEGPTSREFPRLSRPLSTITVPEPATVVVASVVVETTTVPTLAVTIVLPVLKLPT